MPNYEIIYTVEAPDAATALSAAQYGVDPINAITPVQGSIVQQVKGGATTFGDKPGVKRLTEPFTGPDELPEGGLLRKSELDRPQYAEFSD